MKANSKILFFTGFMMVIMPLLGQEKVRFFNRNDQLLFTYEDGRIYAANGDTRFTVSGNIIFYGDSKDKDDFAYLIRESDVFDKKLGYIYDAAGANVLFSVHKGKFFQGTGRYNDQLLLTLDQQERNMRMLMMAGPNYDTIGYSIGSHLSGQAWCAVFLAWMESGKVGERMRLEQAIEDQATSGNAIVGRMKLEWDTGFYQEWEWDGSRLRPRWGNRPEDEWVFDGQYLTPYWGNGVQEQWKWDGQYLKPAWGEVQALTFIWDSTSIRPFWEYREDQDWVIEDGLAYPKWDRRYEREWTIQGYVPVPLIALIVLGFADR